MKHRFQRNQVLYGDGRGSGWPYGDEVQEFYLTWTRTRETSVGQLQDKATNRFADLGRKGEVKIEQEAQKVEVAALKTELNGLEERLNALEERLKARKERLVSFASRLKAEEARSGKPARDLNPGRDSSGQHIGAARDGSDFSPGSPVAEPSIHTCPRASGNQFVSNKLWIGRRIPRSVARFFVVALIGVGAMFAWQFHGDGAKEVVRTWVSSLGSLLSVSTTKSPLDVVAAKQTGSTPAGKVSAQDAALPQPAPVPQRAPTAAATSPDHSVEQLAAKQEQMSDSIATLHAEEPDIKQNASSPPLQNGTQLTPTLETRPTTIEGWTLREVTNGTAVLEGPDGGIWSAKSGDTVPGLGKIESYVRSNGRWAVATTRGLILMQVRQNAPSSHVR